MTLVFIAPWRTHMGERFLLIDRVQLINEKFHWPRQNSGNKEWSFDIRDNVKFKIIWIQIVWIRITTRLSNKWSNDIVNLIEIWDSIYTFSSILQRSTTNVCFTINILDENDENVNWTKREYVHRQTWSDAPSRYITMQAVPFPNIDANFFARTTTRRWTHEGNVSRREINSTSRLTAANASFRRHGNILPSAQTSSLNIANF